MALPFTGALWTEIVNKGIHSFIHRKEPDYVENGRWPVIRFPFTILRLPYFSVAYWCTEGVPFTVKEQTL